MKAQPPEADRLTRVRIPAGKVELEGDLDIPPNARGLVIFAHGSGSSRHSPRNKYVAQVLRQSSLGTLLVDLFTEAEDSDYRNRFDIARLAMRLIAITQWTAADERTKHLRAGYFGASTGAAAALLAAADAEVTVHAVVSRGGRVDMAELVVAHIKVPTLLIVGEGDYGVRELNEAAYQQLTCQKELAVVPHATHLFEEPGALERVAELAADWFRKYLGNSQ